MVTKNPALILASDLLLAYAPPPDSEAVAWYRLLLDMEGFTYRTGWALGAVWDLVHTNNYLDARTTFDDIAGSNARPAPALANEVRALRWVPNPRAPLRMPVRSDGPQGTGG